jgi:hypothetical protein
MESARDLFHLLRQQRRTVHLDHAQRAMDLVHPVGAARQRGRMLGPLDIVLEGLTRLLERRAQLVVDPDDCL